MSFDKTPNRALKPCPICGNNNIALVTRTSWGVCFGGMRYSAWCCLGCGAETDEYGTEEEAVEAWNRGEANESRTYRR